MPTPILKIQNLSVKNRLCGVSLEIHAGEIVGILGQNGAGKSTLLNALASLEKFSGDVFLFDQNLKKIPPQKRAQMLAIIFQNQSAAWDLSVLEIVKLGRLPWGDKNESAVENALQIAELENFKNRRISTLSGGEKARVWLARALANTPQILLADEITANLDPLYKKKIAEILKNFAQNGGAVLIAVHDIFWAQKFCDKVLLMKNGEVLNFGETQKILTAENLKTAFETEINF